jgi:hypothetical protein
MKLVRTSQRTQSVSTTDITKVILFREIIFRRLRKLATFRFVNLSVFRPHGTTRLPLDGFS